MRKVFISYSHDSKEHAEKVLSFVNLLIEDGIDCILDQYSPHPAEGWPRWMENNINAAEFVLMICTRTYYNRVMGTEEKGTGLGIKWEGNLIYNLIYESGSVDDKFIPVLFTIDDKKYIPLPLKGKTFYTVTDKKAYIDLYRRLTHQPEITKPEFGEIKSLGTKQTPDFFSSPGEGEDHVRIETTKLPITSPELFGREKQLAMLDRAWEDPHTRIISFIAEGGVGKSPVTISHCPLHFGKVREKIHEGMEKRCVIIEERGWVELIVDGMKWKFGEFLGKAEELIRETKYHRRDGEVVELKAWAEKG